MWNGIWKVTVLLAVIGVGLYAAYQAHQGMNRVATTGAAENAEFTSPDTESSDSQTDRILAANNSDDLLDDLDRKSLKTPKSRLSKKSNVPVKLVSRRDGVDDGSVVNISTDDDEESVKSTTEKAKSSKPRSRGLDFNSDFDIEENSKQTKKTSKNAKTEPDPLPADDSNPFGDESETESAQTKVTQKSKSSEKQSKADDTEESTDDSTADLFSSDDDSDTGKASAESAVAKSPANDDDAFTRRNITTDVEEKAAIPSSKRARDRSVRQTEQTESQGQSPFDVDTEKSSGDTKSNGDTVDSARVEGTLKNPPPLGTPKSLDFDSSVRELSTSNAESKRSGLKSKPAAIDEATLESFPRLPPKSKQVLPTNLDQEPPASPPPRLLDSAPSNVERATNSDLFGDGVAGDSSQRGVQQPRLSIEKIAQQQAVLDQPLVYTIVVRNTGNVEAHNVVVEDRIPKGSELVGTAPRAELVGKRLIWNEPVLKPNEEKRISIKVIPRQEGPIGSVARVHFATEVSAEIHVAAPQLDFTVKAPREVRIGQSFDLVFTLTNIGKVDATNVTVRDLVPDLLQHDSGADIECPIGKLAPNESREVVLPVTAIKTGNVVNRAILSADSGVKKELSSAIDVVGEQLVLTRTGQNRLYVERPAVFTNSIRNDGNQAASRVKIAEVIPAGMEFATASDGGRYDENIKAVVWTVGPLEPGQDKSVTVKYVPKSTGTLEGNITATGAQGSKAAVKSSVEVIGKPELQMETLSATGVVTIGERITSKFQLKNTGTAAAYNVQLRVRLPKEVKLIAVRGTKYQQQGEYIVFDSVDQLAPRSAAAFEMVLEPMEEAEARMGMEILAEHLTKPHRREETIQIARDPLK